MKTKRNTLTLTLTGLFANPNLLLRPGQYAKVRAILRIEKNALLVPQPAVTEMQGGFITSLRQQVLLTEAAEMLQKARTAALTGLPHELLLLDLYCALSPFDQIGGATTADDILNRIFSSFCIGK